MYQSGELIKFSPFVFKNGNQPKPKYCIVLGQIEPALFQAIKDCVKKARLLRRKYRQLL